MIDFAPNEKIEAFRPFVDEFWQLIFKTSYATSYVSNESTLDSWMHYIGTRKGVIQRVQWFYGVDISHYYDKPIPIVLRNIQQELAAIKKELESLPDKARESKDTIQDSDIQHLMRAHQLPLWPDYIDFSIETVIFALAVMIIVIAIFVAKAFFPAVAKGFVLLGIAILILLIFGLTPLINIANRPKRAHWRTQM